MSQLDMIKVRHEVAALQAALATAKRLAATSVEEARVIDLLVLAESKSRALLAKLDLTIDGTCTQVGEG